MVYYTVVYYTYYTAVLYILPCYIINHVLIVIIIFTLSTVLSHILIIIYTFLSRAAYSGQLDDVLFKSNKSANMEHSIISTAFTQVYNYTMYVLYHKLQVYIIVIIIIYFCIVL